ncbi:VWA domain-containing protein [Bianquea renquensis]|jgi:von willebrand factor type A|uniref:VWA domain-containing protein n=1 Tax=Bianquea renquensis TaxID=2763661 RepID=A0A926DQC4_9FIRM|nr:VWA domain-containing protein [Bianquea renquensis]MBC8542596.1 VWA domain-containing protein [Bianquea renquensis]
MKEINKKGSLLFIGIVVVLIFTAVIPIVRQQQESERDKGIFRILVSSENEDAAAILQDFAGKEKIDVEFDTASTMDMMDTLNSESCQYDAAWLSNSIWVYMLDGTQAVTNAKATFISPVVFGVVKSKAQELGFVDTPVYMADIVSKVESGDLTFLMPSATQTNSGASAYLGFLSTLAGNPEVLTESMLGDLQLQEKLTRLFSGVKRSSGSEEYLNQLFISGEYNAMVNYESSFIHLNQQLVEEGREPLYLLYPVDGVSLSDAPFAYVDHGNEKKQQIFQKLQSYLLSVEGQKALAATGRRSGYGGRNPYGDSEVFNPDWGIQTDGYLSPINYPASNVIKAAMRLYQTELKKPSVTVFCLDFSGSMRGEGQLELYDAMEYILNPDQAGEDYIQFSEKDEIYILPFDSRPGDEFSGNGSESQKLLTEIYMLSASGGTDIYAPLIKALDLVEAYDNNAYTVSIVLMTDGESLVTKLDELVERYERCDQDVGIYSITFGDANPRELETISETVGGRVFDGKSDLRAAFKAVRGYN